MNSFRRLGRGLRSPRLFRRDDDLSDDDELTPLGPMTMGESLHSLPPLAEDTAVEESGARTNRSDFILPPPPPRPEARRFDESAEYSTSPTDTSPLEERFHYRHRNERRPSYASASSLEPEEEELLMALGEGADPGRSEAYSRLTGQDAPSSPPIMSPPTLSAAETEAGRARTRDIPEARRRPNASTRPDLHHRRQGSFNPQWELHSAQTGRDGSQF